MGRHTNSEKKSYPGAAQLAVVKRVTLKPSTRWFFFGFLLGSHQKSWIFVCFCPPKSNLKGDVNRMSAKGGENGLNFQDRNMREKKQKTLDTS